MTGRVLQLKIQLKGIRPPVWRRILVKDDITFHQLHDYIQATMGWWDYHLYGFKFRGLIIGKPYEEHTMYDREFEDSRKVKLKDCNFELKEKFLYTYDFGDNWEHQITVENILQTEKGQVLPVCIKGKRSTPPEDVGGVFGYAYFLDVVSDPEHDDYEYFKEWSEGDFDPEVFDIDEANKALDKIRLYEGD
ncbi:MAG: plasmid pRiA4b ORF-3 family protein [Halanaerobiales bacterium]|nr:plasmid pRiA4b ORF-3 family protein [Halanaerobiales bacterium]